MHETRACAIIDMDVRYRPDPVEGESGHDPTASWAHSVGELTPSVAAVAVPLWDSNGTVVAALSIAGGASQFGEDKLPMLISMTRQAADDISVQLLTWHRTSATAGP